MGAGAERACGVGVGAGAGSTEDMDCFGTDGEGSSNFLAMVAALMPQALPSATPQLTEPAAAGAGTSADGDGSSPAAQISTGAATLPGGGLWSFATGSLFAKTGPANGACDDAGSGDGKTPTSALPPSFAMPMETDGTSDAVKPTEGTSDAVKPTEGKQILAGMAPPPTTGDVAVAPTENSIPEMKPAGAASPIVSKLEVGAGTVPASSALTANASHVAPEMPAHPEAVESGRVEIPRNVAYASAEPSPQLDEVVSEGDAGAPAQVDSIAAPSHRVREIDDDSDLTSSGDGSSEGLADRTRGTEEASSSTSAPREPDAAPLADQLGSRIVEQLPALRDTGRAEVHMNLHPPELGRIQIHLTMNDGNMSVQMTVQDDTVKRLLDQQLEPLRVRLNELGVGIGQFDVRRDGSSPQQTFEHDPEDQAAQALLRRSSGGSLAKIYGGASRSTSLLDVFA